MPVSAARDTCLLGRIPGVPKLVTVCVFERVARRHRRRQARSRIITADVPAVVGPPECTSLVAYGGARVMHLNII